MGAGPHFAMGVAQLTANLDPAILERMRASEIEEARLIQHAMLPREPLRTTHVEFASKFRPVAEVGGDFLDYFELDNGHAALYLGDVVGKGLPAAMFAALTVGALRGMHKTNTPPRVVMETLNRRLRMRIVPGRYSSVLYGVFDPATREFCHANSGLPKPVRISSHGCEMLGAGGLPPGLFEGATYDQYTTQLEPGDTLVFCSDGVTDARNPQGDDFAEERLLKVCEKNRREAPAVLLARLFETVDDYAAGEPQHDDITIAALRISP